MMQSMTGFSSKSVTLELPDGNKVHATLTLKSLNSRFLEVNCKLPYALTYLETEAIKLFKTTLRRGTIYFTIHVGSHNALQTNIEPAFPVVEGYLNALKLLQEKYTFAGTVSLGEFMRLPNVFETIEQQLAPTAQAQLLEAIHELLRDIIAIRTCEGQALQQDIEQRLVHITTAFTALTQRAPEVFEKRKHDLLKLVTSVAESQEPDQNTQASLYLALDKISIHEELIRFKQHLETFAQILFSPEQEKGKKLDFTAQELFREVNTMAAKGADALISTLAITIKVELEKIKEQVQNIV